MSFVKPRNTRTGSRAFGQRAKERQKRNRGGQRYETVAGTFDYLKLGDMPIWLRIQQQLYTYMTFNRETKEVEEVVDDMHLEYPQHWCAEIWRMILCSSGPYKKEPCYPCAVEAQCWKEHWEKVDELKKMGMDAEIKKKIRMRRVVKNALAVTGTDRYFEVPLLDNKGQIRKTKKGDTITRLVAEPLCDKAQLSRPSQNGHNMHWSYPNRNQKQLERFNEELAGNCANCATPMTTSKLICADCGTVDIEFDEPIGGEEFRQLRAETIQCGTCHGEDVIAVLDCSGCGEPEEGGVMDFDLRLRLEPVDEKNSDLILVDFRVPDYDDELMKRYETPLDLVAIMKPTPIKLQEKMLGDLAADLDPSLGRFTKSYKEGSETSANEGDNDIAF